MNVQIKSSYCCDDTLNIMKGLIERFNVNQDVVNDFEKIFDCHSYTNLDLGSQYRDQNTKDLDFEKLLNQVFLVADLLDNEVQEYFFACFLADAESQNSNSAWSTDYRILKKKIEERRKASQSTTLKKKKKQIKEDALPDLESTLVAPERLPLLFEWLSRRQGDREWFDKNGYIGSDERNASILLGFANGMRMAQQIKPPITETQLYKVLCRQYSVNPTNEPHKARKNHTYNDVKDLVKDFFRIK